MKSIFVFIIAVFVVNITFAQYQPQELHQGWYRQESGTQEDLRRVQFFSPTNGWICGIFGNAYRTTDGGEHWTLFMPPPLFEYFYFMNDSTGFAFGPSGDTVYAIIMSTDRGQTWSDPFLYPTIEGVPEDMTHIGDTVWLLNEGDGHRSTDGGKTWTINFYTEIGYPHVIAFANSKNGFVVGDHAAFAYTSSGGIGWGTKPTGVSTGIDLHDIEILPNNRIFVVGGERTLIYSDNSGGSWSVIPKLDQFKESYKSVAFTDNLNGLVVGSRGFIPRTTDGGFNWGVQTSGIPIDTPIIIFLRKVFMTDSLSAWTVGDGGIILHTSDAGKSWVSQHLPDVENIESQVFPNPSYGTMNFRFTMPSPQYVTFEILNISGLVVERILHSDYRLAGEHIVSLSLAHLPSGQYAYRLTSQTYHSVGSFTIVK